MLLLVTIATAIGGRSVKKAERLSRRRGGGGGGVHIELIFARIEAIVVGGRCWRLIWRVQAEITIAIASGRLQLLLHLRSSGLLLKRILVHASRYGLVEIIICRRSLMMSVVEMLLMKVRRMMSVRMMVEMWMLMKLIYKTTGLGINIFHVARPSLYISSQKRYLLIERLALEH